MVEQPDHFLLGIQMDSSQESKYHPVEICRFSAQNPLGTKTASLQFHLVRSSGSNNQHRATVCQTRKIVNPAYATAHINFDPL